MVRSTLLAALLCVLSFAAQAETVTFQPTDADFANPMRGWWTFAADDFATASEEEIAGIAARGMTLAYAIVRLDDYRGARVLPEAFIADIADRMQMARRHGIKLILRFSYNYPDSSTEYEGAKDAPLPVVLGHIGQLRRVLAANADVLAAVQAGFVGAWGEWHSSSNGLDQPEAKAAIRDALVRAVPAGVTLQFRYPPDLLAWDKAGQRAASLGFHNDCFLSSANDVGTWAEDPAQAERQRGVLAGWTDGTFFSGETCDAQPDKVRTSCGEMLEQAARFHLSALGRDYNTVFHKAWAAEGCFDQISRSMGYRLRLDRLEWGAEGAAVTITNEGWARVPDGRALVLTAVVDGRAVQVMAGPLAQIGAGQTVTLPLDGAFAGASRLCLSAPDPSGRLQDLPAFAIRFANEDAAGQQWQADQAAFCVTP